MLIFVKYVIILVLFLNKLICKKAMPAINGPFSHIQVQTIHIWNNHCHILTNFTPLTHYQWSYAQTQRKIISLHELNKKKAYLSIRVLLLHGVWSWNQFYGQLFQSSFWEGCLERKPFKQLFVYSACIFLNFLFFDHIVNTVHF